MGWGDVISCSGYLIYEETIPYKYNETVRTTDLTQCLLVLIKKIYFDGNVIELSNGTFWQVINGPNYTAQWKQDEGVALCNGFIIGPAYENIAVNKLNSLSNYREVKKGSLPAILELLLNDD